MPNFSWRRPNSTTSSSAAESPTRPNRSSESSVDSFKRSPSPSLNQKSSSSCLPASSGFATNNCCPACASSPCFDPTANELRILPCLHSFCTQCLMKVYDYLEILNAAHNSLRSSRPASRYSWRNRHSTEGQQQRSSSPSPAKILGLFICPLCHNSTSIFNGGRESIKTTFPVDPFDQSIASTSGANSTVVSSR